MSKHADLYAKIEKQFIKSWENCPEHLPNKQKRFAYLEKRIWESKCHRFIELMQTKSHLEQGNKTLILNECKSFCEETLSYSSNELALIFSEEMLGATKVFIQKAWQFDPELKNDELFQALRNVWIMLGLQSFFGIEVKITPSLLAYSLLYPYTDNLLDDEKIEKEEKLNFCKRFALRLAGQKIKSQSILESKIYHLVSMIESEFHRTKHPDLFKSLLAIHKAQTHSLALLNKNTSLSKEEIFKICITKGSSSVIADGYLVMGDLNEKQIHFLYEYGAYLQILDDLQDARQDYMDGITTCFSANLPHGNLDSLVCKTYYLGKVFHQTCTKLYPEQISFHGLIKRSFALLFIASIVENQKDFSKHFIQKIEKHAPFRFSFLRKQQSDIQELKSLLLIKIQKYKKENYSTISIPRVEKDKPCCP
ncbi:hypothetical protein [Labilibaculum sp.]|uniref:hypothetical protein n=1 Tax=Labilibaculum sp. TaxID=2060723 RepID=UPI003563FA0C